VIMVPLSSVVNEAINATMVRAHFLRRGQLYGLSGSLESSHSSTLGVEMVDFVRMRCGGGGCGRVWDDSVVVVSRSSPGTTSLGSKS
jgi:hypothetical protein